MFKWLILLAVGLYSAFLIGGEDHGQRRAGLRDTAAPTRIATNSAPPVAPVDLSPEGDAYLAASASPLVPMMPEPAVQILPMENPAPPPPTPVLATETPDTTQLRWVTANRANVRAEGRKAAPVTGRVDGGEAVLVLWTEPSGWARIRVEGDGVDGYIHESLLTATNPQSP